MLPGAAGCCRVLCRAVKMCVHLRVLPGRGCRGLLYCRVSRRPLVFFPLVHPTRLLGKYVIK